MPGTVSSFRQAFFSGKPQFTDADVPDLSNKVSKTDLAAIRIVDWRLTPIQVIVVTGSNTGVGKEIAQIVYAKNARVYLMARSEEKTKKAMESIKSAAPNSTGSLNFIRLDLADLASIRSSAQEFLKKETQLQALFNNAGVAFPEKGAKTAQGYELQLGVNDLGTFALTQLLTSTLVSTAKSSPPGSTRVVWTSSSAAEAVRVKTFADNFRRPDDLPAVTQYFMSKLGNYLHAAEFAAQHKSENLVSVSLNPGNLDSELWRTQGPFVSWMLRRFVLYPSVYGAYTNLFAAFSPEVTMEKSGSHSEQMQTHLEAGNGS